MVVQIDQSTLSGLGRIIFSPRCEANIMHGYGREEIGRQYTASLQSTMPVLTADMEENAISQSRATTLEG